MKIYPPKYILIINYIYLLIEIIKCKTSFISNVCIYLFIYYLAKSNIITTFERNYFLVIYYNSRLVSPKWPDDFAVNVAATTELHVPGVWLGVCVPRGHHVWSKPKKNLAIGAFFPKATSWFGEESL